MPRRPNPDEYFLDMAELVSNRSTCIRKQVGCVLVNVRGHVLATGYNGVPRGWDHCNEDSPCPGVNAASGTNLDACFATHAEQNALLQCPDVNQIWSCYVTYSPCVHCTKLLLNTSCKRIVFAEIYAHDDVSKEMWRRQNRGKNLADYRNWIHHANRG